MKLPHKVSYTMGVRGGDAKLFYVRINPKYKDDKGLHAHEYEHVKQWYKMTLICSAMMLGVMAIFSTDFWVLLPMCATVHGLLYTFSTAYRLYCEEHAFKAQMKHNPDSLDFFADALASYYDLSITVEQAKSILK